jgi:hypothetical protein
VLDVGTRSYGYLEEAEMPRKQECGATKTGGLKKPPVSVSSCVVRDARETRSLFAVVVQNAGRRRSLHTRNGAQIFIDCL